MEIPSKFPQFENENVLIVVTGFQNADFYLAGNGVIEKIRSVRIPRRKYSDDEGFFAAKTKIGKSRGGIVSSGAVREYPKEAVLNEFLNQLDDELKAISKKENISYVCLFSPDYALKKIKSSFPAALKNKVKFSIAGNYSHYSPTELIEKIDQKRKKLI